MNTSQIVHRMRKDLYCCYRHFCQGRDKNQQTHCYGHVVKGIILPEPTVGKKLKAQVERVKERRRQEEAEAKADTLVVSGKGLQLKGFGYNITANENVKPSLPHHLSSPFIYCDKVYKKGTRPITATDDLFLVAAENTCNRHLRRDIEIEQQLQKMTKEQRRQFFSRSFNLTESLYYFYSNIEMCLADELYSENFPSVIDNPTLQQLFEEYCRIKKIDLTKRHQYMMVDEKEFKDFVKSLGFPKRLYNLIDEFWELVFKEKIFENYQIPVSDSKIWSKRTSKVISMKAFFYNFKKFYADKNRYTFVFSPNMVRQRNVDLRYELFPWKERYRFLNYRLKQLRPIQFSICQKLSENHKDIEQELLRVIEDRNQRCFKYRVLAKVYYPLVCQTQVNFDNLHEAFAQKLQKVREEMSVFQDFLEAFKDFRRQIAAREQNFDQQLVKATDVADFLAYSKMQPSKAQLVIKWLNKFYKYMHFFKSESDIEYDVNSGKTTLSKNIVFNYDQISQFLHYKCTKSEDQQNVINEFLERLESFFEQQTQGKDLGHSQKNFQKNIVAQFLLRELKADLCSFEKMFAVVKVASPYLEEEFNEETITQIKKILAKNIASPGFTTKFLFSSQIMIVDENCQACSVSEQSKIMTGGNKWRSKISNLMRVFSDQADSLEHVLLDWNVIKQQSAVLRYPNVKRVKMTEVRIEEPQQLVPVQPKPSAKTFNIKYVQIPKQKVYKVKVTKHQHIPPRKHQQSVHSAQSAIFEQQKKPKINAVQQNAHLQECQICKSMVTETHCTSSPLCGCYICLKRLDHPCCRTNNTDDQFSIQSVSDMQDQILRLLTF